MPITGVAFLPQTPGASHTPHFLNVAVEVKALGTPHVWLEASKGMLPVKYFFQPPTPGASFYTTFLKRCGRGESLRNTTCLVGGRQGYVPCKILLLQQSLFLCLLIIMKIIKLSQNCQDESGHPLSRGYYWNRNVSVSNGSGIMAVMPQIS